MLIWQERPPVYYVGVSVNGHGLLPGVGLPEETAEHSLLRDHPFGLEHTRKKTFGERDGQRYRELVPSWLRTAFL